jgi:Na+/H+-dicarboxylate symporter
MDFIKENKSHIIGIFITILIGAIVDSFSSESYNTPLVENLLMSIAVILTASLVIAGLIVGISWIFTKRFSMTRVIKIMSIVSFMWTTSSILSAMFDFVRL